MESIKILYNIDDAYLDRERGWRNCGIFVYTKYEDKLLEFDLSHFSVQVDGSGMHIEPYTDIFDTCNSFIYSTEKKRAIVDNYYDNLYSYAKELYKARVQKYVEDYFTKYSLEQELLESYESRNYSDITHRYAAMKLAFDS